MTAITQNTMTMTSREIAELTGKRHCDVLRDIDNLIESLNADLRLGFKSSTYEDSTGKSNRKYEMDRDSSMCVVSGYDANARMKIIKRWQELEAQSAPGFAIPTTFSAALQLAADQARKMEEQARQIEMLNTVIDNEFGYSSILRAAMFLSVPETTFNWRPLKAMTLKLGLEVKHVPSPRYKYQNLYPIKAFEQCYPDFDFDDLQPEAIADKAMTVLAAPRKQAQIGAM